MNIDISAITITNTSAEAQSCSEMQIDIFSYMEIVKKRLIDTVPMKIMFELKRKLKNNVQKWLQEALTQKIETLMGEPFELTTKRQSVKESICSLEKSS